MKKLILFAALLLFAIRSQAQTWTFTLTNVDAEQYYIDSMTDGSGFVLVNDEGQQDDRIVNGFQWDGKMYVALPDRMVDWENSIHYWIRESQIHLRSGGGELGYGLGVDIILTNMVGGNYWFDPNNGHIGLMASNDSFMPEKNKTYVASLFGLGAAFVLLRKKKTAVK